MTKLDFALWDAARRPRRPVQAAVDTYEEHIRLVQHVEELGWHSYFVWGSDPRGMGRDSERPDDWPPGSPERVICEVLEGQQQIRDDPVFGREVIPAFR